MKETIIYRHFSIPDLPPSLNRIYKLSGGRMYKHESVGTFEELAFYYTQKTARKEQPLAIFCKSVIVFYFKDKKKFLRSDVSNLAKVTEDSLVKCGLLKNDNLIVEINYSKVLAGKDATVGYFCSL